MSDQSDQTTLSSVVTDSGKFGHYEPKWQKKKSESMFTSQQLTNYTLNSDYDGRS